MNNNERESKALKKIYTMAAIVVLAVITQNGCSQNDRVIKEEVTETMNVTPEETTALDSMEEDAAMALQTTKSTEEEENAALNPEEVLSDDIYSFQIQLNGKVYQFPMEFKVFTANGWLYDGNESEMVNSGFIKGTQVFDKGKLEIYADILNYDINAKPCDECYIAGISIDHYQLDKAGASASMAKGIEIGTSTADDIRTAYGTPSYDNTTDSGFTNIEYRMGTYQSVRFSIDSESKKLSKIQIQNYAEPEDFIAGEISTEIPEIVERYEAPESVSSEFADFTVEYGGTIYQLPAPVRIFEANGWKVMEDRSDMQVAGHNYGWVTMMKDNQTLKVIANNYSEQATEIHNCFVTSVKSDEFEAKVPMIIARGITIGMSQADLEKILSEFNFEKDNSSNTYVTYTVTPVKSILDRYTIAVRKSDGIVCSIKMEYTPQYSTFAK